MTFQAHRLSTRDPDFEAQLHALRHWSAQDDARIESRVTEIVQSVRTGGDAALLAWTAQLDGVKAERVADLGIGPDQLQAALAALPEAQQTALRTAADRIRQYHTRQLEASGRSWSYEDEWGNTLGQQVTPLDRVGIYVPGGKAAYPSSVLMNAIPAQVAGVRDIVMVVPTPQGERNPLVLAAAAVAGVNRVWTVGGAQAVAALAYGTETIGPVDKITGPGNAYVASAKRRVFGQVGIDMIAGPSEILVMADGQTPAEWVAMDLFSQAEHDELAQSILLCPDAAYLDAVAEALQRLLPGMPRAAVIQASLQGRGALIHTRSLEEACDLANRLAPEHLEVATQDPQRWLPHLRHAGAIFLGAYTSESLGDYCAGPNHVLPTSGTARFSSPLGVMDFQKRSSLIGVSAQGAWSLGQTASVLAHGEGLQAHARAAEMRVETLRDDPAFTPATPSEAPPADWVARVIRPDVRALSAYPVASAQGLIKLDVMENPYTLPAPLRAALGARLAAVDLNRYPAERTQALAARLAEFSGLHTEAGPQAEGVLLGNGSDELISLLTLACARPGARVLAPVPSFVMYDLAARLQGLPFVGVPLTDRFELDGSAMQAAIARERPTLVWLAHPNNPTANAWPLAQMRACVRAAQAVGALVVMDEAYQPFADGDTLAFIREFPQVLVMRTLSKFGLAGVRLGYLMGPQVWIDALAAVRPPFNVSVLNTEAAHFALDHAPVYAEQAAAIVRSRQDLIAALAELPGCEVFPSQANMVLLRVPDATAWWTGLKARGILVKNVGGAHPLLQSCLRLTVGTPEENAALLTALKALAA